MASYQAPAVDHNLYKPVMPQTNVGEVFQLMNTKQNIYNQNLASINSQISSMNDLTNSVSNEFVKQKIDKFNVAANDSLKKYANLDFSIQDNAKLVDNLYDPLVKDQDFLTDFSATSHRTNELRKGLSFRDSTKKEERDAFNMTNLMAVTGADYLLQNAKNSKELKEAASEVQSRYYSPYVDVTKEIETSLEKLGAKISYSYAKGGYIVTTGAYQDSDVRSLENWLQLTLSDAAKNQLRIESTVDVDNMVKNNGQDIITSQYISGTAEDTDRKLRLYNTQLNDLNTRLSVLPKDLKKMSRTQIETYNALLDGIGNINGNIKTLVSKKEELGKLPQKIQDGTFSNLDINKMLIGDLTNEKIQSLTNGIARSYAGTHHEEKIEADQAYIASNRLSFDKTKHKDEMIMKQKEIDKDMAIAGIKYDQNGNLVDVNSHQELKTTEDPYSQITNIIATRGGISEIEQAFTKDFKSLYESKERDRLIKMYPNGDFSAFWKTPDAVRMIRHINDPNNETLKEYDVDYQNLRDKYWVNYESQRDDYKHAVQDLQVAVNKYNSKYGTSLHINSKGEVVEKNKTTSENKSDYTGPLKVVDVIGNTLMEYVVDPLIIVDKFKSIANNGKNSSSPTLSFQEFLNSPESGVGKMYSSVVVTGGNMEYAKLSSSIDAFNSSFRPKENNLLQSNSNLQVNEDLDKQEVLDLAYEGIYKMHNVDNQKKPTERVQHEVTYGEIKGGTKVRVPSVKIEDVFEKADGKEYTPEQLEAYKIITSKGLNMSLEHPLYTKRDITVSKFNENVSVSLVNDFRVYKHPGSSEATIAVKEGKEHYWYSALGKSETPVRQTPDGLYQLVPSTEDIKIDADIVRGGLSTGQLQSHVRQAEKSTDLFQSVGWQENLSDYIKNNPTKLIKRGDKLYISNTSLNDLLPENARK